MAKIKETIKLPLITMKGLVVFPGMVLNFDVTKPKFVEAIKTACFSDKQIFLVTQKSYDKEDPKKEDLYITGVVAEIKQVLKTPDKITRVLAHGVYRAKLSAIGEFDNYNVAEIIPLIERNHTIQANLADAYERTLKMLFRDYASLVPKIPDELISVIESEKELNRLFELILFNIFLKTEDKQQLLELNSLEKRVKCLIELITEEIKVLQFEAEINDQIKDSIDSSQREYILREQMKAISKQLGGGEEYDDESYEYSDRIQAVGFPEETEEKLIREAAKMMKLSPSSQEYGLIKTYLDSVLEMPWNTFTKDTLDMAKAEKQLDKDHYGLKKVKERILEIISVRKLNPEVKSQIICLVGPPGVGKTSIGRSIAEALGRSYTRVSLGGVRDEAEIRGHRKTYVGAMPGRIINAIKQAKCMNPVMLFDEIDKMGSDYKGDPASAMLEVLDPEQNSAFTDHYLEIPVDLSDVLFITTANTTETIPAPLLDRMEIIELGSYTREEKFNIAKRHLVKKQAQKHSLSLRELKISDKALYKIIECYTREAGVRGLEKQIATLCRKASVAIENGAKTFKVDESNLSDYLGVERYSKDEIPAENSVGTVNGLAWTQVGGTLLPIEVSAFDGSGKIELTGNLGDVMKESAKTAVSYIRSKAYEYGVDADFYKTKDIHIHAPEAAIPKDGPSAGLAITTALLSELTDIPIKRNVAMTGEISLKGKALAIGGLKEKSMAAYKAGCDTVIIPKDNVKDLSEVNEEVKSAVRFISVSRFDEVIEQALEYMPKKRKSEMIIKADTDSASAVTQ